MGQRLKRWESPRRQGRNDKGRGGSARQRQKQKQFKLLKQKLTEQKRTDSNLTDSTGGKGAKLFPLIFVSLFLRVALPSTTHRSSRITYAASQDSRPDYH
jgi:hypothetical protein